MKEIDIKEMRQSLRLTQDDLAAKLGVSRQTVVNYEKGLVIPESKKSLLYNILQINNNDEAKEPAENYLNASPNDINKIEELIIERSRVIQLLKDESEIKHQKKMIELLQLQIKLINNSKDIKTDS